MIINEDDLLLKYNQRLISRRIIFAGIGYIHKATREVFIPLVDDVILDLNTGRMYRMLSHRRTRINIKKISTYYRQLDTSSWGFLDHIDPSTYLYIPEIKSRRVIRKKKGMYCNNNSI